VIEVWAAEGVAGSAYSSVADAANASDADTFCNQGDNNNRFRMSIVKTFGNEDEDRRRRVLQCGAPYILAEAPCSVS
jgi:hypothetical protein